MASPNDGAARLWKALSAGDREGVRSVLDSGVKADTAVPMASGRGRASARFQPLHHAASRGDLELAELLLAHGATVDGDNTWSTPLAVAAWSGQGAFVDMLLARGAHKHLLVQVALCESAAVQRALTDDPGRLQTVDENQAGVLHYASAVLGGEMVRLLLSHGASSTQGDRLGHTPLHTSCNHRAPDPDRQREVIVQLVEAGADINAPDVRGVTPLHVAVRARSVAAVETLLDCGADVDPVDRARKATPLRRAVTSTGAGGTAGRQEDALAIVRLLLAAGASRLHEDKTGKPVVAVARGREMQALLESALADNDLTGR